MAILLSSATGKTAETNKASLQRLAANKGDRIAFLPVLGSGVRYDTVALNGKTVGLLFDSHESAIAYLTRKVSRARPMAMANPRRKKKAGRSTKKNPGTITGTAYFPTVHSAIKYYKGYGYDNTARAVNRKIKEKEIFIGKPAAKSGQRIYLHPSEGRYFIEEI